MELVYEEETIEVDLPNEAPLVVGEFTTYIGSAEKAKGEVDKLLERVRMVEEVYCRSVELKVLAVANLGCEAAEASEKLVDRYGLMVLTGGDRVSS